MRCEAVRQRHDRRKPSRLKQTHNCLEDVFPCAVATASAIQLYLEGLCSQVTMSSCCCTKTRPLDARTQSKHLRVTLYAVVQNALFWIHEIV